MDDAPKVLISYSHDSRDHADRVLQLANQLRDQGVDVTIDQYEPHPPSGWPVWMERQVAQARYVLVLCTRDYYLRAAGQESPGKGRGATWESVLIRNELYDTALDNDKFIPILLRGEDEKYILQPLRGVTRYLVSDFEIDSHSGYEALYRRLTNQEKITKSELGPAVELSFPEPTKVVAGLPPKPRVTDFHREAARREKTVRYYGIALFMIAAASLTLSYWNAPLAWQLQFDFIYGDSSSPRIGGWFEGAFTGVMLLLAYGAMTLFYADDTRIIMEHAFPPWRARGLPLLINVTGIVLFVSSGWHLWSYHRDAAPESLKDWAIDAVKAEQKPPSLLHKIGVQPISIRKDAARLNDEAQAPDAVSRYRRTYLCYLPYSAVNCSLLAVPLFCVLLLGLINDAAKAWAAVLELRRLTTETALEPAGVKMMVGTSFPEFHRVCVRSLRRAMFLMLMATVIASYLIFVSNLAKEALFESQLTLYFVFTGPVVALILVPIIHEGGKSATLEAIENCTSLAASEQQVLMDDFSSTYHRSIIRNLRKAPFSLAGTAIYLLMFFGLIICHFFATSSSQH